jgi:hypothetical protein
MRRQKSGGDGQEMPGTAGVIQAASNSQIPESFRLHRRSCLPGDATPSKSRFGRTPAMLHSPISSAIRPSLARSTQIRAVSNARSSSRPALALLRERPAQVGDTRFHVLPELTAVSLSLALRERAQLDLEHAPALIVGLETLDQGRHVAASRNGGGQVRELPFGLCQFVLNALETRGLRALVEDFERTLHSCFDDGTVETLDERVHEPQESPSRSILAKEHDRKDRRLWNFRSACPSSAVVMRRGLG